MSDINGSSSQRQRQSAQVVMELILHEASCNGDDRKIEELQMYLRKGKILINQPDVEWGNRTPLHCAAERGNPRSINLLLNAGADPNAKMVGGWTPAHCAAEAGRTDNLLALVDFRAAIDTPDDYGDTPRNVADIYGQKECAELLKRAEENPVCVKSFKGKQLWRRVQSFTEEVQEIVRKKQ